ncbi:MAG: hypothetical protein LC789_18210 [Actinobacteria bacterium]|nr:hypothetical protein [Actinomycetota bacterium]
MRWAGAAIVAAVAVGGVAAGVVLASSGPPDDGLDLDDFEVESTASEVPFDYDPEDLPDEFRYDTEDPEGDKRRYRGYFCGDPDVEGDGTPGPAFPTAPCTPPDGAITPLD